MTDLGSTLRTAREARGISLAEAEVGTRIRARFLAALEDNDFNLLGGEVITRGFLRNYAAYLGLDPAPLLAELGEPGVSLSPPSLEREPRYITEPLQTSALPLGRILFTLLILLIIGAVAMWLWWQPLQNWEFLDQLGLAPASTITPIQPAAAGGTPITSTQLITQTTIIVPFSSATPSLASQATAVATATLPPRTPTPDLFATPTSEPTATTEAAPVDGVVISAQVIANTWVRVLIDDQSEPVIERTLQAGESFEWSGQQQVTVRVGNAGGLDLSLNGQSIGVLGDSGQVLERQWQRNPDGGPPIVVEPQG